MDMIRLRDSAILFLSFLLFFLANGISLFTDSVLTAFADHNQLQNKFSVGEPDYSQLCKATLQSSSWTFLGNALLEEEAIWIVQHKARNLLTVQIGG